MNERRIGIKVQTFVYGKNVTTFTHFATMSSVNSSGSPFGKVEAEIGPHQVEDVRSQCEWEKVTSNSRSSGMKENGREDESWPPLRCIAAGISQQSGQSAWLNCKVCTLEL